MKETLLNSVVLLLMGIFAASPVLAQNPIFTHKYTADPNAFIWNNRIYVYASFDNNNPATRLPAAII